MPQSPRTIHPSDAQDERIAKLPLSAAYTYAYLPTILDDEGRAKDQPAVFNGYLWPLRTDEHPTEAMTGDLAALVDAGLLCRYSVDGQDYVHDPAWRKRQRTARAARPVPSAHPRCPTHDTTFDDVVAKTVNTVSEQVNAALGNATTRFDESRMREAVARLVEDVTFSVDPEKAATYGQKIRSFMGGRAPEERAERETRTGAGAGEAGAGTPGAAQTAATGESFPDAGTVPPPPGTPEQHGERRSGDVWRDATDDPPPNRD